MRKNILLICLAALCKMLAAQPEGQNWYRPFNGNIGKYMITMHLHKVGSGYYGYYYYDRTQQPIFFSGSDTLLPGDSINLSAYLGQNDERTEIFRLQLSANALAGIWQKDANSNPMVVKLLEQKNPTLSFSMITTSREINLRDSLPGSPTGTYTAATIWPGGNDSKARFLKRIINADFDNENSEADISETLSKLRENFLNGYIDDNKDTPDSILAEYPYSYNIMDDHTLLIAYWSPPLLTLASHVYSYTGGAHGNYGTGFISVNLETLKKVSLADVLTPAGIQKLNAELEAVFRTQSGLKPGEPLTEAGLFENKIEANENFYVTAKGIGFNYVPYEIGPYAMGEVNIFIPFSRFAGYLQPAARKWMSP